MKTFNTLVLLALLSVGAFSSPLEKKDCLTGYAVTTWSESGCKGKNQGTTTVGNCDTGKCLNSQQANSYHISSGNAPFVKCGNKIVKYYAGTGCGGDVMEHGTWDYNQCIAAPKVHGSARFYCG